MIISSSPAKREKLKQKWNGLVMVRTPFQARIPAVKSHIQTHTCTKTFTASQVMELNDTDNSDVT